MTTHIHIPYGDITRFCVDNRIRKLSLFGSVLRNDNRMLALALIKDTG